MSCDLMGNKQRAWLCAGCGYIRDRKGRKPRLLWAEGERPILTIPARYDEVDIEVAFGWAIAELAERRRGWLGMMGRVIIMSDPDAEVA